MHAETGINIFVQIFILHLTYSAINSALRYVLRFVAFASRQPLFSVVAGHKRRSKERQRKI